MIVVDLGCAPWGMERSIDRLVTRFHPEVLYGFDPYPHYAEGEYALNMTRIVIERKAAWTHDGEVAFTVDGSASAIGSGPERVPCFDFAGAVVEGRFGYEPFILKVDIEGAEYDLIMEMTLRGAFELVKLLLVEFHGDRTRPPIPVPWEAWS